jgi:hypothetical protein
MGEVCAHTSKLYSSYPKKTDEDDLNERIIDLKWKRQTKSHDPEEYYLEE